ncbi:hypothetical protein PPTG_19376 [Phytophthora nicotianae INRA-310]|uniref:Uncharacterized protein n=2 Tax=Phytophthora nicotianae TaxID=4792 RepID=W2PC95_PHYN3|nr:hypothetical protein PPTG_19376 [Phytophthora nicotianae INRA-310]ETM98682.1 hypothetical protein PPTG_19376 [Phytophthora nicotianae INRA-310]KUF99631.1 hypothetical protein AM588_10008687 [Phytophthora nicotianae]
MQRRARSRAAGQVPVAPLPTQPLRLRQTQSRAAALTNGAREFRKLFDDSDGPVEDNNTHAQDTAISYSEDLLNAFKRKTQELCDETREQYEQKLERQEAQHERQVQVLQRQLRDVVGSSVSLAEHEQILATAVKEQQLQLEEARRRHQFETHEFRQKWQAKMTAARKQGEQEKAELMQRIEQLELLKSEAAVEMKERELSELRWSEKLETVGRAKEIVEQRQVDATKRLENACRIISTLKTRLRNHERVTRDLESQRDKLAEEVMNCKVAYAELKGNMDTRVARLEKELDHALQAAANEKANECTLQNEVERLREQVQRQQCSESAKEAEHKQLQTEVEALRNVVQAKKKSVIEATERLNEMQQRDAEAQLQHQDLRTRLELHQAREASLKRKVQRLKERVGQFKAVVEKLIAENKQLGEEASNRDASTEAWAKKLFGRQL